MDKRAQDAEETKPLMKSSLPLPSHPRQRPRPPPLSLPTPDEEKIELGMVTPPPAPHPVIQGTRYSRRLKETHPIPTPNFIPLA